MQLVEAGGLSEAARRFGGSPPVLSRRLSAMESRLGVRLFLRSSRRFELTQEGSLLHQRALQILAAVEDAEAEASGGGAAVRGVLRVGAPSQIGRRLVAPFVGHFAAAHPQVDLQLVFSGGDLDVIDDGLDIAIRIGPPQDPNMVTRRLLTSRHVVVASPGYVARHGAPQTPQDLARHACLRQVRGWRVMDQWTFMTNGTPQTVQVGGTLATTSGELLHEWVLEGRGIGLKALWNVGDDIEQGRLLQLLPDHPCREVALYAVYQRQGIMPARMRAFLDGLVTHFEA